MNNNFESFNARNYSPKQVAQTFVNCPEYEDLWRNQHTVVLGPRGSGKTTLFKMLTVEALYSWNNAFSLELRNKRPFTAIYVPTDMHWHHQLEHASISLKSVPSLAIAISHASVTTSILIATLRTFKDRLYYEEDSDVKYESELCTLLMKQWKISNNLPCFNALLLELMSRIAEIRLLSAKEALLENNHSSIECLPSYFHSDYFAEFVYACTAYDTIVKNKISDKWALCFDELELAPTWMQTRAFSEPRSSDEGILLKLSTSPIPITHGITEASPKHDFRLIRMWNYFDKNNNTFENELTNSILKRRYKNNVSLESLLGSTEINLGNDTINPKQYEKGSPEWKLFKRACKSDPSLRRLFESYGINPENPIVSDPTLKDSVLRKAKPLVLLRDAMTKANKHNQTERRSRKSPPIYCGVDTIYRISDGNPRRLIGILDDLCDYVNDYDDKKNNVITPNIQTNILIRASKQFIAYTQSLPSTNPSNSEISLTILIKTIAAYFSNRILKGDFDLDPPGSFTVDSNVTDYVVELLRLGVYHGAFIYVDPVPDTIDVNLKGKRLRLSYMFSPVYKLPITLLHSVTLSSILAKNVIKTSNIANIQQSELDL
jgi:hypothetical protein